MRKAKYKIAKTDGAFEEVEGELMSQQYGIHKREDGFYALTHLSSGRLVYSSRLKRNLQLLASEPEFFDTVSISDIESVKRLADCVSRFAIKTDWK